MEINNQILDYRNPYLKVSEREGINPNKDVLQNVQQQIQLSSIKGSSSLQKELLAIISATSEEKVQKLAKSQIEKGFLDIKI